jgi:replicative DNA helicase
LDRDAPVELLTVQYELAQRGTLDPLVGGLAALASLIESAMLVTTAGALAALDIVADAGQKATIRRVCREAFDAHQKVTT